MKTIKNNKACLKYDIPLENDPDVADVAGMCSITALTDDPCCKRSVNMAITDHALVDFIDSCPGLLAFRPDGEAMAHCLGNISNRELWDMRFDVMKKFGELLLDFENYYYDYLDFQEDGTARGESDIYNEILAEEYLPILEIPLKILSPSTCFYSDDIILPSSSVKLLKAFHVERLLKLGIHFLSYKGDPKEICGDYSEEYAQVGLYYIKLAVNYDDKMLCKIG